MAKKLSTQKDTRNPKDIEIEIADGVVVPSLQNVASAIEKSIMGAATDESEVKADELEIVNQDSSVEITAPPEAVESGYDEALQALPEPLRSQMVEVKKPVLEELNDVYVAFVQESKHAHHSDAYVYREKSAALNKISIALSDLRYQLSLIKDDSVNQLPIIQRIKAEILGVE